ncbi:plasmid replication initiation factor-related protein [Citrifermentans bemidjiense Bem]|uniref:Plasmid replication initiation factor-related protein n=1 Tax=Citrifermentans bemidjiense (strain ATCC BAA-1014 / DSM 16622 / JCM 12645 / Bem) TaxID=404380 RepID=B5E8A0_CITBB|nr:plasmid replication initiation factor [Citrifermentans bemidjiense]ACH40069.1 plasmid replication initiation factor-related protein [Citrifermentans bemidjiense Bem]
MSTLPPYQIPTSMAESVTRHAQNPPISESLFLSCGIDTLDLGLYVSWDTRWNSTKAGLEDKKSAAQQTTELLDQTDIGREFLHHPSGKAPNYRYQLHFPEYRVYIAISDKPGKSPNVYVTIKAETLWHVEFPTILELLEFDLDSFGGTIERIQPSRVDLCADFRINPPPTLQFIQQHRVSRSTMIRPYLSGETLETFYSGSPSSPVQIRIYDKGKEILKTNKQWFLPIWGVDTPEGVWRVEFQLRRTFLHQYRIKTIEDLWGKIGTIWEYLTAEWFSLRLPDNEKAERRTIHPWWLLVQECSERFGGMSEVRRTYTTDTVEPIQKTLAHICGRLVSIAAQEGIKDRMKAILHLEELIYQRMDEEKFRSEYKKKAIKLGYRGELGGAEYEG